VAVAGLKRIYSIRKPKAEKILTLLLLFVLLTVAVASVASVLASPDWGSLWIGLVLGLLIGWGMAIFNLPAWISALILSTLGIIYALIYAGQVGSKLFAVSNEIVVFLSKSITHAQDAGINFIPIQESTTELFHTISVILIRLSIWILALVNGEPTFDPVVAGLAWIILVWFVAAWAGWMVVTYKNALLAVLPAILLSVGALSFGQRASFSLYLMLGLSLILLAIVEYGKREQNWENVGTAFPPRKWRQVMYSAMLVSIGLVFASAVLSSISIPRILDWVSKYSSPAAPGESGVADSLGIVSNVTATQDMFEDVRNPGLPRDKLIGSGPELSKRIVMTVAVDDFSSIFKDEFAQPLYWRSFTYDIYTGHGWRTSNTVTSQYDANQLLQTEQASHHMQIDQVVRPAGYESQIVFMAGEPVSINHSSEIAWRSPGDVFGILIDGARSIKARSSLPVLDEQTLRSKGQNYPDWVKKRFLHLPSDLPNRVREMALQLTASEPTPYDRVRAIEQYLRTIPYTLDVPYPPLDQDLVDYFLFDLRQGYCDYYASAMVIMARAAGVPARFATGYASGTYDLNAKRFIVSEADAHSWVEVYFPEIGWVPFEPTAGRPSLDRSEQLASSVDETIPLPVETSTPPQSESMIVRWSIWLGLLATIGILGFAWVGFDEMRLHNLSEKAAAKEVFFRLRRYGAYLEVSSLPGNTPNEFALQFRSNIQSLARNGLSLEFTDNLNEEIGTITDRIVGAIFRLNINPDDANYSIVDRWKNLRRRLFLMWVVKKMNSIRGILARAGVSDMNNLISDPEERE